MCVITPCLSFFYFSISLLSYVSLLCFLASLYNVEVRRAITHDVERFHDFQHMSLLWFVTLVLYSLCVGRYLILFFLTHYLPLPLSFFLFRTPSLHFFTFLSFVFYLQYVCHYALPLVLFFFYISSFFCQLVLFPCFPLRCWSVTSDNCMTWNTCTTFRTCPCFDLWPLSFNRGVLVVIWYFFSHLFPPYLPLLFLLLRTPSFHLSFLSFISIFIQYVCQHDLPLILCSFTISLLFTALFIFSPTRHPPARSLSSYFFSFSSTPTLPYLLPPLVPPAVIFNVY